MSLPLSKLRTTIQAESGRSCLLLLDPTLLRELRALFMPGSIRTETETVIKKILPYLQRRGYDPTTDFDFETPVKTTARYSAGYIDILVTCGRPHPQFVIEAKRSSKRLSNKDRDQAISYARSYAVNAPFVVVTNGSDIRCYNAKNKEPIAWDGSLLQRIPPKSQVGKVITHLRAHPEATIVSLGKDETLPFRPGLALKQLNALFARCHNTIRDVEKNEEHTFADFSKILFLKLLEEKHDIEGLTLPYSYRFYQLADKPDSQADQVAAAVREMLGKLRGERDYRTILAEELQLKKPTTFLRIVRELAAVSFYDSALDSKGAAFEYFVRATLKGKRLGQYFTPRQLVQFMYTLIGAEKVLASVQSGTPIKVLDPACGTGGFLVFMLRDNIAMADKLLEERRITAANHQKIVKQLKEEVFFGSDANEGVASAAKMNMVVAGDGHANVISEDSLKASAKNWSIESPDCDLIITNPPFGTSEASSLPSGDLSQYPQPTSKGQHLFLQKMVLATKRGGEICTVIDEGVLNTDTSAELRRWLLKTCELLAVVRLPEETFKPNKINVKASVIYLRRREEDDEDLASDYQITFCDLRSLGYEGSGDPIRAFELDRLLKETADKILDRSTGSLRHGYSWDAFDVNVQELVQDETTRFDLKYWFPDVRKRVAATLANGGKTIGELNLLKPTARGRSPSSDLYVDESDGYALVVKAGSNISKFGQLITTGDYIEQSVYEEYVEVDAPFVLQNGDVLLASTGDGTIGKCCVYRSERHAIADGHVTIIRVDQDVVCPEYLADYLRAGLGAEQVQRLYTGSTGLVELSPQQADKIIVDLLSGIPAQRDASACLRSREMEYADALEAAEAILRAARESFVEPD